MAVDQNYPCTDTCPCFADATCSGHITEVCISLGHLLKIFLEQLP